MNPLIDIFNYQYIQQQAQEHHFSQIFEVQKSVKALKDFLESFDKIEPNYHQLANSEYCAILLEYFRKHGVI